jgi:protein phosphatase
MGARLRILSHLTHSTQGTRPAQEDFILSRPESGILMLADGFGGPQAGASAARTACESVAGFLIKEAGDQDATLPFVIRSHFSLAGNVLFNALVHANRKVLRENGARNVHEKGGASVVAGFVDGNLLSLANVGGCLAWLIRDGRAAELVAPRSYARLLDPLSRKVPPGLDAPLTALGTCDDVEPEIFEYRLQPGDWVVLHSDGFPAELIVELGHIQQKKLNPESASAEAKTLLEYAPATEDNRSISISIF